jgi:hypothetical protein
MTILLLSLVWYTPATSTPVIDSDPCTSYILDYLISNQFTELLSSTATCTYSNIENDGLSAQQQCDYVTNRTANITDSAWNSGQFPPQWIQYDLTGGSLLSRLNRIHGIRLQVNQWLPVQEATHQIWVSSSASNNLTLVKQFNDTYTRTQWLSFTFNPSLINIRYLNVKTIQVNSWVAWFKILVYGQKL